MPCDASQYFWCTWQRTMLMIYWSYGYQFVSYKGKQTDLHKGWRSWWELVRGTACFNRNRTRHWKNNESFIVCRQFTSEVKALPSAKPSKLSRWLRSAIRIWQLVMEWPETEHRQTSRLPSQNLSFYLFEVKTKVIVTKKKWEAHELIWLRPFVSRQFYPI